MHYVCNTISTKLHIYYTINKIFTVRVCDAYISIYYLAYIMLKEIRKNIQKVRKK